MISIITPNFNSQQYITKTYQSLIGQTHSNWEWIITDDGSTDNSPELILELAQSDPRVRFYKRESKNKGASVCRNNGIRHSKGEYLIFLDADDLFAPTCLEERIRLMNLNPALDFGVFKMGYFKNRIGDLSGYVNLFFDKNEAFLSNFIAYNTPWAITCPIWKSSFLKSNNICFSEKYQRLQDPEFHAKILLKYNPNFKVFKDTPIDCFYRQGSNNITSIKTQSFQNITKGFICYIFEIKNILEKNNQLNDYQLELKQLVVKSFHSILFMHRLTAQTNPLNYYDNLIKSGIQITFSRITILFFYWMNLLRLTFVKGAGISRLWNLLESKL